MAEDKGDVDDHWHVSAACFNCGAVRTAARGRTRNADPNAARLPLVSAAAASRMSGAYIVLPRLRATSRKITTGRTSSKLKRPITKTRSLIRTERPANRDVSARAMRIRSPTASCLCQESTGPVRKNYVEHLFATDRGVLRAKRHLLPAGRLASRVMRLRFSTIFHLPSTVRLWLSLPDDEGQ